MIAKVNGTMLTPGVSKNGRLYTAETIRKAVTRMQARLADPNARPIVMRTHHQAGQDSRLIVGHLRSVEVDDNGKATYEGVLNGTQAAKDILEVAGDEDISNRSLRNVSIWGYWNDRPRNVRHDGELVETADDLEIDAVDFTAFPGVEGARIDKVTRDGDGTGESASGRWVVTESVEATVHFVDEAATPAISKRDSGLKGTGGPYGDPGYQKDKKQRYQLDTKAHAKAAWAYINRAKNQKPYNPTQLKAIKGRIRAALKKFGVTVTDETVRPAALLGETTIGECYACDDDRAGFSISAHNGPINVTVSAYSGIDPAELEVIATAAMQAAVDALKALDPDMDADIDVDGAPNADSDNSMDGGESVLPPVTVTPKQMADQLARLKGKTTESLPAPQTPAPTPAGPTVKESAMPDEQKAVEQAATTEAAEKPLTAADLNAAVTEAFKPVVDALKALAPQTPAAPAATESTTTAPAPAAETAEPAQDATHAEQDPKAIATEAQKAVQAAIREAIPELLSEYGLPRRKGYRATESADAPANPQELWDKRGEVWNTVIPGGTPTAPVAPAPTA